MKAFKNLKKIDMFGTPIQTFLTSRDKNLDKKSFSETHGSICGGIISIVFAAVSLFYLFTLYANMINGSQDNVTKVESNFNFNGENGKIHMTESNYLPYLELLSSNDEIHQHMEEVNVDEFNKIKEKDGSINVDQLSKYIEIRISILHRSNNERKYYAVPFRQCRPSDFVNRGVPEKDVTILNVNRFLCPDITDELYDIYVL